MRLSVLLFALLFAAQAQAATPRCGTDDFGNAVCMDKDGEVSAAPKEVADELADKARANCASGGAVTASSGDANREGKNKPRCGTDPFGNTVCR